MSLSFALSPEHLHSGDAIDARSHAKWGHVSGQLFFCARARAEQTGQRINPGLALGLKALKARSLSFSLFRPFFSFSASSVVLSFDVCLALSTLLYFPRALLYFLTMSSYSFNCVDWWDCLLFSTQLFWVSIYFYSRATRTYRWLNRFENSMNMVNKEICKSRWILWPDQSLMFTTCSRICQIAAQ